MIPLDRFQARMRDVYLALEGKVTSGTDEYSAEQHALYVDGVRDGRIGDVTFQIMMAWEREQG